MTRKVRDVVRALEQRGWVCVRQNGTSHRQFRKPGNPFVVTIHGKPSDDLARGTLSDIIRKSGITLFE
ncbi:MAG: type II toxin-antitoxin system HicA family toxin [Acidobacteria bacterium]|nr:type II toxin-antitoxin system HicA family toxin [Acidobacteriota bacterium]